MQRRRLLTLGFGAAVALAVTVGGFSRLRPESSVGHLSPKALAIFTAFARAVLDGSLPELASARDDQLQAHLRRVGEAISSFPPATQTELSQLLSLLATAPGRRLLTGLTTTWDEATVEELQACLQRMRTSSLSLRQQTYHALRDLTNAAFYADPQAWPLMGYPGPVSVG